MINQNLNIKQVFKPIFSLTHSYLRSVSTPLAKKELTFFSNKWLNQKLFKLPVKKLVSREKISRKVLFSRFFYNGLGYKIFCRKNTLFVWLGLTHYTLLEIPPSVKVFAKKRRIFITGTNYDIFNNFIYRLKRIRKIDIYKAKGLSEVRTYKSFIKMKSGKKKQY